MTALPPTAPPGGPSGKSSNQKPHRTPGWVKALGAAAIVLALIIVILHLTGLGFGSHMHQVP